MINGSFPERLSVMAGGWALALLLAAPVLAQGSDAAAPVDGAAAKHWAAGCIAAARGEPLDCAIEQRVVNSRGGQIMALVRIRVPAGDAGAAMMLRVPTGIYLPGKLTLNLDGETKSTLEFQRCDQDGCYAGTPLAEDLLSAMRSGKTLELTVQNLDRQTVPVTVSLEGFSEAYDQIK